MNVHRYPWTALVSDYFRAVVGMALGAMPLFMISGRPVVSGVFAALFVLFAVFGVRTLLKHRTEVAVDDDSIRINLPRPRAVRWADVSAVRLKYFVPRRRKNTGGWFQLVVDGDGGRVSVDSGVSDFKALARRARETAERNGITLDSDSVANFMALDAPLADMGG